MENNIILAAQSGLKGLMFYEVTKNTEEEYAVAAGFRVPAVQTSGEDIELREGEIPADDDVYAKVREEKGATGTLTLAELPLSLQAKVEGGEYDPTVRKYTFPEGTVRPTFAIREQIAFIKNQGWRVNYRTVCEILQVQMSGESQTRSDGVEINAAQIVYYSTKRKCDGQRIIKYEPLTEAELAAAEADFIAGVTPETGP